MKLANIRWGAVLGGVLLAEVALIASSIIWVAIYSHGINPGQPMAVYHEHAQQSGVWVSLAVGMPAFFLICRWLGRRNPPSAMPTAMALFAVYLMLEASILSAVYMHDPGTHFPPMPLLALNFATKLLACWLGARSTMRRDAA